MSNITDIYAAIAAQAVSVAGVVPTAFPLSALPNAVETARLPCRILVPVGTRLGAGTYRRVTLGQRGVATIDWTITDMLLWRAAAQGQGLKDIAETLVEYCGVYAEMTRLLGGNGWTLNSLQMGAQLIEWPAGGDRWYDGVVCTLGVSEILQG